MITSFSFPTNIRFGVGAVKELPAYLKQQGLARPLIVSDPNVAQLPFFQRIRSEIARVGLAPETFSGIHPNPVKADVLAGREAYEQSARDAIVAIGGGAAMDVARAIALSINNRRELFDYDDLEGGDKYITEPIPHFVCVPTTSGTGSEVGRSAIISEDVSKRKRILFHPTLMAKQVFADPALTFELPPHITAATGMDALTHNLEALLAKNYHPIADGIALEGIRLIVANLETAVNRPNEAARSALMMGSMMGAIAFQKGLGVVHSLAHPLSTLLDMHHGLANAINLPYGMQFNLPGLEPRFQLIAHAMQLEAEKEQAVIQALFQLNESIGLPTKLRQAGVKSTDLGMLADLAVADFAHPNNPKPVTRDDFMALYEQAH